VPQGRIVGVSPDGLGEVRGGFTPLALFAQGVPPGPPRAGFGLTVDRLGVVGGSLVPLPQRGVRVAPVPAGGRDGRRRRPDRLGVVLDRLVPAALPVPTKADAVVVRPAVP